MYQNKQPKLLMVSEFGLSIIGLGGIRRKALLDLKLHIMVQFLNDFPQTRIKFHSIMAWVMFR